MVTAPSGAGKSSLIEALLKEDPSLRFSVSYTTRAPRPGEVNGREYHFVDEKTFLAMLERSEFLESASARQPLRHFPAVIREALARGQDWCWRSTAGRAAGAQALPGLRRRVHPAPSVAELERRMRARGQDSDEVIRRRMSSAEEEISHAPEFNYAIINKDFDEAKRDLQAIIRVERLKPRI